MWVHHKRGSQSQSVLLTCQCYLTGVLYPSNICGHIREVTKLIVMPFDGQVKDGARCTRVNLPSSQMLRLFPGVLCPGNTYGYIRAGADLIVTAHIHGDL